MSAGEVLPPEMSTMPAAVMSGAAATAAPEHEVPITPITSSSATTVCAAAWPPSLEHRSSSVVPRSTSKPLIGP